MTFSETVVQPIILGCWSHVNGPNRVVGFKWPLWHNENCRVIRQVVLVNLEMFNVSVAVAYRQLDHPRRWAESLSDLVKCRMLANEPKCLREAGGVCLAANVSFAGSAILVDAASEAPRPSDETHRKHPRK